MGFVRGRGVAKPEYTVVITLQGYKKLQCGCHNTIHGQSPSDADNVPCFFFEIL